MRAVSLDGQAARMRQFLGWDIVFNLVTLPCLALLYELFPTPFFALLGLGVFANAGLLLFARGQVQRGYLQRAVFATCIGLWLIAGAVGLAVPVTLPFVSLLLVWPVALALPYLSGAHLRWVMGISTVASLALALAARQSDPFGVQAALPNWLIEAAVVICVPVFTAFIFLLLWHYNAVLRESEHLLEVRVAQRTRELAEARDQALEATRAKSTFLANMSHELRTPLNAILGYTELILDGIYGQPAERISEVLERVDTSGHHLLELINDVLDLSKIEAGQLTLSMGEYSLAQLVREVCLAIQPLAAEKGLVVDATLPEQLPGGTGDERRIRQVLLNLLGNAVKFTEAGTICVTAAAEDGAFHVTVADSGPGVAETDRERIFDAFQQADSSSTKDKGGSGLGLAISRRMVELHGGRLWLESDSPSGAGARFAFTLPIKVPLPAAGS